MMKKLTIYFIGIFFLFCNSTYSQHFEWINTIASQDYEHATNTFVDKNGNFYISGTFRDSLDVDPGEDEVWIFGSSYKNTFLIKLDSNSNYIYSHYLEGVNAEQKNSFYVDKNLNYYRTGRLSRNVDLDPGPDTAIFTTDYSKDSYFQKFDSENNMIYAARLDLNDTEDYIEQIIGDENGNTFIVGNFHQTVDFDVFDDTLNLTSNGDFDAFIAKYDPYGNVIWAKHLGAYYRDVATNICISNNGNILIGGWFSGEVDFDPGADEYLLQSGGVFDVFLLCLSPDGDFLWAKSFGGQSNDYLVELYCTKDNDIVLGGSFRYSCDFNPDPDDEYWVYTQNSSFSFVLNLDKNGEFKWVNVLGNDDNASYMTTMAINADDHIYYASSNEGVINIELMDSVYTFTPVGEDDINIVKTTMEGENVKVYHIGSEESEFITDLSLDAYSNIYGTVIYREDLQFSFESDSINLENKGDLDIYIFKLNQNNISGIIEKQISQAHIAPNPNQGIFKITLEKTLSENTECKIYTIDGRVLYHKKYNKGTNEIELQIDHKGACVLELSSESYRSVSKIIIE